MISAFGKDLASAGDASARPLARRAPRTSLGGFEGEEDDNVGRQRIAHMVPVELAESLDDRIARDVELARWLASR